MRLALIYWVVGVNVGILFMPGGEDIVVADGVEPWRALSPLWIVVALNLWIWSSIAIDSFSFNYTRDSIVAFIEQTSDESLIKDSYVSTVIVAKDCAVALACLAVVLLISNHTYWISMKADPATSFDYVSTALNPSTVLSDFSHRTASANGDISEVTVGIPGILVTSLTAYLPSLLWIAAGLFCCLIMVGSDIKKEFMAEFNKVHGKPVLGAVRATGRIAGAHTQKAPLVTYVKGLSGLSGSFIAFLECWGNCRSV
ncbi:MAG: hypothetical protein Phyf2KO_03400 [Phycisphaerales bacterium]